MVYAIMFLALYTIICGITLISIGAEFLGFMMIIIYVGAVIILFLFVVMMLEVNKEEAEDMSPTYIKNPKLIWTASLFIIILNILFYDIFEKKSKIIEIATKNLEYLTIYNNNIKSFETLYTDNFLYLLVSGSLLLVALTAAIALTNNKKEIKERESYVKIWQNINRTLTINYDNSKKNKEDSKNI